MLELEPFKLVDDEGEQSESHNIGLHDPVVVNRHAVGKKSCEGEGDDEEEGEPHYRIGGTLGPHGKEEADRLGAKLEDRHDAIKDTKFASVVLQSNHKVCNGAEHKAQKALYWKNYQ